ncbi:MAG: NAD+ synthase [Elusimicrobia bacterium RIFOXYB2_FULL_48_7]|nr:MAG: NAD+ synthase [Elusimicrobia bacterium RIFOXYB2_FULL_48_7]
MAKIRVGLAQINTTVGDLPGNSEKIIRYMDKARDHGCDIAVFPELALCGYLPEDLLLKPYFIQKNREYLDKIIEKSGSIFAIVGFPCLEKGKLYNAAAVIRDKKLLGIYKKIYLPNYGVFDEMRYFQTGDKSPVFSFKGGLKIGVNICEDIWHRDGPQKAQAAYGKAKLIINISGSPYHMQKINLRQKLLSSIARENKTYTCYCNLVGGQDELVFDGASMAFDNRGKMIALAKQFSEDLLVFDINPGAKNPLPAGRIENPPSPIEEVYRALVLGLRDYVEKNGFKKIVLGLSGGVDSALVAAIGVDALGKDNVAALTMPSVYSSGATLNDAKKLAKNLGIKLYTIPIKQLHTAYLGVFRKVFKGTKPDITEENIQARIRGNLLMAFSNKFGWLVVTTGNKSESSVGYCTLYGDTAGGLALIKDVPKTLVYKLAKYRNIPQSIIKRVPTAELRKNQTDQDTLPPYPVLDKIIDEYVEKDRSMAEISGKGLNKALVKRVISMIDRNEYKRRQSPIGIKITPKAFGRDRRMPITNKFYESQN